MPRTTKSPLSCHVSSCVSRNDRAHACVGELIRNMMVSHIGDRRQRRRSKERNGMTTKQAYNLYWVTTEDHGEDWFVFARTPRSAAKSHEDYIGYEPGDASARQVLKDVHLP